MVACGNKMNRNKLDGIREGPFKIIKQISPLMFKVDAGKRKEIHQTFSTRINYILFQELKEGGEM